MSVVYFKGQHKDVLVGPTLFTELDTWWLSRLLVGPSCSKNQCNLLKRRLPTNVKIESTLKLTILKL